MIGDKINYMNSNKTKILTINIEILSETQVKGATGEVTMIQFRGNTNSEIFCGSIKENGTDTQIGYYGKVRILSARYMLSGTDSKGNPCKLFIENNAELNDNNEFEKTSPKIITDSPELAWLETAVLSGELDFSSDGLKVHIYVIK